MKKILFKFLIALSFIAYSQSSDVSKGCVPLEVQFTAPANSPSFFWDFKDGVTSDKQNPSNVFTKAGVYDVEFRQSIGGPVIGTVKVTVFPSPSLDVTVTKGCAPSNVEFVNASTVDPGIPVDEYVWVYGDGQSYQGKDVPKHMYFNAGKYSISLKLVSNSMKSCTKTVVFNDKVEIVDAPVPSMVATPNTSCNDNADVTFTNNSFGTVPMTYNWNFGNGKTSTDQNPAIQKYTKGQYLVTLTANYSGMLGCSRQTQTSVSVGNPTPKIIVAKDSVCINAFVKVKSSINGFFEWTFPSDANMTSSQSFEPEVKFSNSGIHIVKLKVTSPDGQCFGSVVDTIFVYPELQASIIPQPLYTCTRPTVIGFKANVNQSSIKYHWDFGKDTANTAEVSRNVAKTKHLTKYDVNAPDTIFALLKVTNTKTGCIAYDTVQDIMQFPTSRLKVDQFHGCAPLSVTFDPKISVDYPKNRITSWLWDFGDGQSLNASNNNKVNHVYNKPGVYLAKLIVATERGCLDTSYTIQIEVGEQLNGKIDFEVDKNSVCAGDPVTFKVTKSTSDIDNYHFSTEANRSFHCADQTQLTWSYNYEAKDQDVTLTVDYNGCLTSLQKSNLINVKNAVAKIDYAFSCNKPNEFNFKNLSQNADSFTWTFGDGKQSNAASGIHIYDTLSQNYSVVLTADNSSGCAPSKDSVTVKVRFVQAKIKLKDTLLCARQSYDFDASDSKDVNGKCINGYMWRFPDLENINPVDSAVRPLRTDKPMTSFMFGDSHNKKKQRVWLEVTDENGCKDTSEAKFSVYAIDVKPVSSKTEICLPNYVDFDDLSIGDTTIVDRRWYYGDSTQGSGIHVSYLYDSLPLPPDLDHYYVRLLVKDALGCSKYSKDISILRYSPTSNIVIDDRTLCLGDTARISASDFTQFGSKLKFKWDFGNGITDTNQTRKIVYDDSKSYQIKLVFEEIKTGCKDSTSASVDLQRKPWANFTTDVDTLKILCAPQNVQFKDVSLSAFPISNNWNFGNGQFSNNPEFALFYEKGKYKVTHTVSTSYGCLDDTSKIFSVFRPEGNFEMDKNTICKGDVIQFKIKDTMDVSSFTWAFGDGVLENNSAPVSHRYNFHPPSGQTLARLIVRGFNDACSIERQLPVNIQQVVPDFERENELTDKDTVICFNAPDYHFKNKSIGDDVYTWDFGDGEQTSSIKSPVHTYALPGKYKVRLMVRNNSLGCPDTLTKIAIVAKNPEVKGVGDTICQGQGVMTLKVFAPIATSNYKWIPKKDLNLDTGIAVVSSAIHTQKYTLIETDSNNCEGTTEVLANVVEPLGLTDWDTTIVVGDQIKIPAFKTDLEIFKWSPEGGLSCLDCSYPLVRPLRDTVYNLSISDVLGCFTNQVKYDIKVRPETFVKMPTVFTPNGDGANDLVFVKGWGIKELVEFKIFNRWGQQLFSTHILDEGWDGTYNGNLQNSDVYVYKIKVKTWTGGEISQEGYINLVH